MIVTRFRKLNCKITKIAIKYWYSRIYYKNADSYLLINSKNSSGMKVM